MSNKEETISNWERRLRQLALFVARIALGYLFFTQLWWKLPPTFGCPADFAFTTGTVEANGRAQLQRTNGLCDWIGVEQVWSTGPRPFFVADTPGDGRIAIDLGWLARLNGLFIQSVIQPNIQWFGWVIFLSESFIFVSLFFGLFSRLGGLVALGMSAQLMMGLAGIRNPLEWEWGYNLMVVLALVNLAFAPGRILGVDALLRPRLQKAAAGGNKIAGLLARLT